MEKAIPLVTGVFPLVALLLSFYYRSLKLKADKGVGIIDNIEKLPAEARIKALRLAENVFDLDVGNLDSAAKLDLAKQMLAKKAADSQRNFILLIVAGIIVFLVSLIYMLRPADAQTVRDALRRDRKGIATALVEDGFFEHNDRRLVDALADDGEVKRRLPLFERVDDFNARLARQPALRGLREASAARLPPFEEVGDLVAIGVPGVRDQPPRYIAFVRRGSPYAGKLVTLRARTQPADRSLTLYARGAITAESDSDVQLNQAQYLWLAGDKLTDKVGQFAMIGADTDQARDPSCPTGIGFRVESCALPDRVTAEEIPGRSR